MPKELLLYYLAVQNALDKNLVTLEILEVQKDNGISSPNPCLSLHLPLLLFP
jgi:hypothetical protein